VCSSDLIARTSWLFAPWGKNFVRTILRIATERDSIRVVSDQFGKPSAARQVSGATLSLFDRGARGTRHVCGGGSCSWYELARETVRLAGLSCEITACTTEAYPTPARRPLNSVLDLTETTSVIGPMNHWRDELAFVVASILGERRDERSRKAA